VQHRTTIIRYASCSKSDVAHALMVAALTLLICGILFTIAEFNNFDDRGAPSGQGRLLRRFLKPVVQDGKTVAWDVVFYAARPARDYYLVTAGCVGIDPHTPYMHDRSSRP
jgi:hypothetical protein